MPNKVPILDSIELHKLDTRQLLKRRDSLLKCEEAFELSDRVGYEPNPIPNETGLIEFKKTPEWAQAYAELKSILSKRENDQGSIHPAEA